MSFKNRVELVTIIHYLQEDEAEEGDPGHQGAE